MTSHWLYEPAGKIGLRYWWYSVRRKAACFQRRHSFEVWLQPGTLFRGSTCIAVNIHYLKDRALLWKDLVLIRLEQSSSLSCYTYLEGEDKTLGLRLSL